MTAFPATDGLHELGDEWLEAPLVGIVTAFDGELPRGGRRRPACRGRALRGAHPDDGDHDVDLRMRAARALDGDARDAAARARPPRAADARLPPGDRRDHARRDRRRPRRVARRRRRAVPREHVLLRRPARLHARAARRDPAPRRREPDLAPAVPGRPDVRSGAWTCPWLRSSGHPSRRPCSCSRWSRTRAPATPALPGSRSGSSCSPGRAGASTRHARGRRPARVAPGRRVVPGHPRPDEARRHRRGDGRDRDRAREGERGGVEAITVVQGAAGAGARRGACPRRRRARRGRGRGGSGARRGERRRGARRRRPRPLDRARDRRGGGPPRCGPDRARLVAALAAAVPVLLADRRPRAPARAPCEVLVVAFPDGVFEEYPQSVHEGRRRRAAAGPARPSRSTSPPTGGTSRASTTTRAALARLGEWRGGFVVGHAMDLEVLERAGVAKADAASSPPTATTRTSWSAQVLQRRYEAECVVVRDPRPAPGGVLRGARPAHRLPDEDGDRDPHRRRPRVRARPRSGPRS